MDASWYLDVNDFAVRTPWLHGVLTVYAVYGVAVFAVLVAIGWWLARSQDDPARGVAAALWAGAGTVVAVGINQLIGGVVARPRPYLTLHGVEVLVVKSSDYSFPSDHAVTAGAAAAGLWIIGRYAGPRTRGLAVTGTVLAVLLAFARVYVGAHYPGDVVAGLLVGAMISVLGWLAVGRLLTALVTRLAGYRSFRPLVVAHPSPNA
ncbi:MAG: phosphatase PAP2 family protein [Frankiales bacterium]|nr:phosphatase PAP2 family protein [Frankiales bacterium]